MENVSTVRLSWQILLGLGCLGGAAVVRVENPTPNGRQIAIELAKCGLDLLK